MYATDMEVVKLPASAPLECAVLIFETPYVSMLPRLCAGRSGIQGLIPSRCRDCADKSLLSDAETRNVWSCISNLLRHTLK